MKVSFLRLFPLVLLLASVPAFAVTRDIVFDAPKEAAPGTTVHVTVLASTNAHDGEQVGFFHGEFSIDGGKKWTSFCYDENAGEEARRALDFTVGNSGTKAIVRVRVAYRGGKAGDVDFAGGPVLWEDTWGKWRTPPTKFAIIYVR